MSVEMEKRMDLGEIIITQARKTTTERRTMKTQKIVKLKMTATTLTVSKRVITGEVDI